MKKIALPLLVFALASCNNDAETNTQQDEPDQEPVCTYSYDHASTTASWTAYKFTEKAGVSGTFDQIEITGLNGKEKPLDVIIGAQFSITTSSVNTDNPDRDAKITNNFFAALSDENITGVINYAADGLGSMDIMMNGVQNEVEFTYELKANNFSLTAEINMDNWGCEAARIALNNVCQDLHTGNDGESVLWPDVTINVSTVLVKTCN